MVFYCNYDRYILIDFNHEMTVLLGGKEVGYISTYNPYKRNIDVTKIEPFYKRWFCLHKFTGGARKVIDRCGRTRHARICTKCGQRDYID